MVDEEVTSDEILLLSISSSKALVSICYKLKDSKALEEFSENLNSSKM